MALLPTDLADAYVTNRWYIEGISVGVNREIIHNC